MLRTLSLRHLLPPLRRHVTPSSLSSLSLSSLSFSTPKADLSLLLQQCNSSLQAKQIHAQLLLSLSLSLSPSLSLTLVSTYTRLNLFSYALSIFLSSPHNTNPLFFNSVLRSLLSLSQPTKTFSLYSTILSLGASPDSFTFPLILRACSDVKDPRPCFSVHAQAISVGLHSHLHVANELVITYGKLGCMDFARKVFDEMPGRDTISWNGLISGYSRNHDLKSSREVFEWMEDLGLDPNPVSWTALISAHAKWSRHEQVVLLFDKMKEKGIKGTAEVVAITLSACPYITEMPLARGRELHTYSIKSGFENYPFVNNSLICMYGKLGERENAKRLFNETGSKKNLVTWNALISSYASAGLCDEAYEIFTQMKQTGEVSPNVVSWSAVIGGFTMNSLIEQSLDLFREMQRNRVSANSVTVVTVLYACAELAAFEFGREVHCHVIRGFMDCNLLVQNGLVNMYTKSGRVTYARKVFERMICKDLISWNSMIAGYGMNGLCDEALTAFSDMVNSGTKPDSVTFISVLSACSHSGRVSDGRQMFDEMLSKFNISPQMEHYSCMVDLLGRAGLINEAETLIENMPIKPDICVWGALLNSYRMHGSEKTIEERAGRILGLEGESTGNYMLVSNLYAASGKWEESKRVRVLTRVRGLKKNPGQSWIEVKNRVFVFCAGGVPPVGAESVYGVAESLYFQMESEE